jgi:hypothetical protein
MINNIQAVCHPGIPAMRKSNPPRVRLRTAGSVMSNDVERLLKRLQLLSTRSIFKAVSLERIGPWGLRRPEQDRGIVPALFRGLTIPEV